LPLMPATIITLLGTALLTGAIHEDGFADACDGLFSGKATDQAFEIMKDSRLGTFGVLGLLFNTLLKACLLFSICQYSVALACLALISSHCIARCAPLLLMATLSAHSDKNSKLSNNLAQPSLANITLIFIIHSAGLYLCALLYTQTMAGATALNTYSAISVSLLLAMACSYGVKITIAKKLAFYNGDCLGFIEQIAEISMLIGFASVVFHSL
ncbi:MAG: adenosylcobinamide-GDP ribazoletransferase, partial [Sinobacterium sp.]|nr:adenosylcobinamide-GDP ribazoletransferase [Sinobacterium sp.]